MYNRANRDHLVECPCNMEEQMAEDASSIHNNFDYYIVWLHTDIINEYSPTSNLI